MKKVRGDFMDSQHKNPRRQDKKLDEAQWFSNRDLFVLFSDRIEELSRKLDKVCIELDHTSRMVEKHNEIRQDLTQVRTDLNVVMVEKEKTHERTLRTQKWAMAGIAVLALVVSALALVRT